MSGYYVKLAEVTETSVILDVINKIVSEHFKEMFCVSNRYHEGYVLIPNAQVENEDLNIFSVLQTYGVSFSILAKRSIYINGGDKLYQDYLAVKLALHLSYELNGNFVRHNLRQDGFDNPESCRNFLSYLKAKFISGPEKKQIRKFYLKIVKELPSHLQKFEGSYLVLS